MHWSGCPAGCGNHEAADLGFRGMKVNVGDRIIEAVAIYAGGRTGPDAVAGKQLLDVVPCDGALADVVASLVSNLGLLERPRPAPADFVPIEALAADPPETMPAIHGGLLFDATGNPELASSNTFGSPTPPGGD